MENILFLHDRLKFLKNIFFLVVTGIFNIVNNPEFAGVLPFVTRPEKGIHIYSKSCLSETHWEKTFMSE